MLKYLTLGVVIVSLAILARETLLKPKLAEVPATIQNVSEIKIDFDFLESQKVENLLKFEGLSMPQSYGRSNPFSSY